MGSILSRNSWMFIFFFEKQKHFLPELTPEELVPRGGEKRCEKIWDIDPAGVHLEC